MTIGLIGRKAGMTRVFTDAGESIPVTVIEAGRCLEREDGAAAAVVLDRLRADGVVFAEGAGVVRLRAVAGGIEAVFTTLALHHQISPPTINIFNQDPECDLDYCANTARDMKIDVAVKNNFGFGGTNGTLVLRRV